MADGHTKPTISKGLCTGPSPFNGHFSVPQGISKWLTMAFPSSPQKAPCEIGRAGTVLIRE